ncbi:MAG TPA: hypothetical protein VMN57_02100 [Anaerolineales bacterium]|nr:hypothetical protein [Anaerolineales bacterium]
MQKPIHLILIPAVLLLAAACTGAAPPSPSDETSTPVPTGTAFPEDGYPGYPVLTEPSYPIATDQPYPLEEPPVDVDPAYPAPEAPGDAYPAPDDPGCGLEPPEPQRRELVSADGIALVGMYYPAAGCDAPVVLLFHQFGSEKSSWTDLARWLQNRAGETAQTGGVSASPFRQLDWFPSLPADLSFAVFALDFRNHGESQSVTGSLDLAGLLLDAQAAMDFVKTLPGVDASRIITMGASIGADASVDVCLNLDGTAIAADQDDKGCIGALPLSPGSFLEVPYIEVVTRLGAEPFNINIHCIAAEGDGNAPDLCSAEVPGRHQATVYTGRSEHGIALLAEGFVPDIGQVILDFLLETLEIEA